MNDMILWQLQHVGPAIGAHSHNAATLNSPSLKSPESRTTLIAGPSGRWRKIATALGMDVRELVQASGCSI